MPMTIKYFSPGDGAGTATAEGTQGANTGSAGSGEGTAGGGERKVEPGTETGDAGSSGGKQPEKKPDGKANGDPDWKTEAEKFKSQLGKQGEEVGKLRNKLKTYDTFEQSLQNPETAKNAISQLAKEAGLKIDFSDPNSAIDPDKLHSGDPDDVTETFKQYGTSIIDTVLNRISPDLQKMNEFMLKQEYPDFDELGDTRTLLRRGAQSGQISGDKLFHLAARGAQLPDAMKAAEQRGYEKAMEDIAKKTEGSSPDAGGHKGKSPSDKEADAKYQNDVITHLNHRR